mgnify:FL=1
MIHRNIQILKNRYFDFWGLVSSLSIVIIAVLLIFPLTRLILASFMTEDGTFTSTDNFSIIETYIEFFSERFYYETLLNSFYVCILATIFSVIIGVPTAYLVSRIAIPGKIFIRVAIVLTFVSPPFIGAYAWILLLGRNGVITGWLKMIGITLPTLYGWGGIVLVFTLQSFPFVFLMMLSGFR